MGFRYIALHHCGLEHIVSFTQEEHEEFILMCQLCLEQFYLNRR